MTNFQRLCMIEAMLLALRQAIKDNGDENFPESTVFQDEDDTIDIVHRNTAITSRWAFSEDGRTFAGTVNKWGRANPYIGTLEVPAHVIEHDCLCTADLAEIVLDLCGY